MSSVSVFIPCYNYAHYLTECVESVLNQEGVDVRVLIIDDASPDNTSEVAEQLVTQDSRVAYYRHIRNKGHIATYNEGIAWADGDYTVLLSADDMLTPGALQRATALMDAHPNVGFVYGSNVQFTTYSTRPQPQLPTGSVQSTIAPGLDWLTDLCRRGVNTIASPEVVVRTGLQKHIGGYNAALPHSGDMEMWMRFAVHADVGRILNADQAFYRVHPQSMHVRHFPAYRDVQQRQAAFQSVFALYGDQLPPHLRTLADRSIARASLWAATMAFDYGETADVPVDEMLSFAHSVYRDQWFDPSYLRSYGGLGLRRLLGARLSPRVRMFREQFGLL